MGDSGCQRRNRKCKRVLCPHYLECVDGMILKLYKVYKLKLIGITQEVSEYTNWDELFTLQHVIGILRGHGITFKKHQVYYAIRRFFNEDFHFKFQKREIAEVAGILKDNEI